MTGVLVEVCGREEGQVTSVVAPQWDHPLFRSETDEDSCFQLEALSAVELRLIAQELEGRRRTALVHESQALRGSRGRCRANLFVSPAPRTRLSE